VLAGLEPNHALVRYRAVREVARHRQQIALLGVGLLFAAALLFLAERLQG
jgi:hypothetical protein